MKYAILADIHGNLEALTSILEDAKEQNVDENICLGDIVGYGANPEECVKLIRENNFMCVAGNHDHAAIGKLDITMFNQYAREASIWTGQQLSEESKKFLESTPFVEHLPNITLVHGSLQSPELFNYIQTVRDAEYNFRMLDKPVCFCGHSHVPLTFFYTDPMTYSLEFDIDIDFESKTIVNVGSVGQPRDEHPESSYAIYDEDAGKVTVRRVPYDVETASKKIAEAGLPKALALRLWLGK
jgi:predicted phosphodiesterase